MAVFASIAELRFVHLRMAGNALRAGTRRGNVALIVTSLALGLGVARGETQPRVIFSDVGDLGPVGLVVAGDTFVATKPLAVRILVAGHAVRFKPQIRGVAAAVLAVMTVPASGRPVSTLERPTRLAMIEELRRAARPSNEPGCPSEMLDVTATAVLPAILPSVEAGLLPYLGAQVLVAAEAGIGIDPFPGGVALAAVLITVDLGVVAGELARGQKLGAGLARHQRSGNRGHGHQTAHDQQCRSASSHSEKIQR